MKITAQYSYSFWRVILARVQDQIAAHDMQLDAVTRSVPATILTKDLAQAQVEESRAKALLLLKDIEYLSVLQTILSNTLAETALTSGITMKENQKAGAEQFLDFHLRYAHNRPSRLNIERALSFHATGYESLRNAGNGDQCVTERNQFRVFECELPVLGEEDCVEAQATVEMLKTHIAALDTEIKALKSNTQLSLQFSDDLSTVLSFFKLELFDAPDQEEASADTQPQAEPTPEQ